MKKLFTLGVCLLLFCTLSAQQKQPTPDRANEVLLDYDYPIDRIVSTELPMFNGQPCQESFSKWCHENLSYPPLAAESEIQGRVIIEFTIGADSLLRDAKVLQGDELLQWPTLELIKKAPRQWTPARQNGRPTAVKCTVSVTFKLE